MPIEIKKVSSNSLGDPVDILPTDKAELIKTFFKKAKDTLPDYDSLEQELATYIIELPQELSLIDLSKMNKLYAFAQGFFTRTATISNIALGSLSLWEIVHDYLCDYLKDKESALLVTDEISQMRSEKIREAAIRNKLKEIHNHVRKVKTYLIKAELFVKIVENKKKELMTGMNNLTKQINTLKIERGIQ
jgi:hypothetical protein